MTKIMLVEDDNNLREIYQARLNSEGYETVTASDGEEALSIVGKEKPDLIILDVMMPKISGFDTLDLLKSSPVTKSIKVIMMTALSQAEDRARAEKLGAQNYLVKSQVTLEDIVKAVKDALSTDSSPDSTASSTSSTSSETQSAFDNSTRIEPQIPQQPMPPVSDSPATPTDATAVTTDQPSTMFTPSTDTPVVEPVADATAQLDVGHTEEPLAPTEYVTPYNDSTPVVKPSLVSDSPATPTDATAVTTDQPSTMFTPSTDTPVVEPVADATTAINMEHTEDSLTPTEPATLPIDNSDQTTTPTEPSSTNSQI